MRAPGRLLIIGALVLAAARPIPAQAQSEISGTAGAGASAEQEGDESGGSRPEEPTSAEDAAELNELTSLLSRTSDDAGSRAARSGGADAGTAPAPSRPKTIQLASAAEPDLAAAWARWRKASRDPSSPAAQSARAELLALRAELALPSLEAHSAALARAADERRKAGDPPGAIVLASTAVELSPELPDAHRALASAHFSADPTAVGKVLGELWAVFYGVMGDPRYLRPAIASLGAALLLALLATAAVVALVLFGRNARYYFHDFHHLLPRGTAGWQSFAFAALLVSAPVLMRLGIAPALFALLAAVALYLPLRERLVSALLLACLGLLPLGASAIARHTALAETVVEDLLAIERGGWGANSARARVERRAVEQRATQPELFALGRDELRRGRVESAVKYLQAATAARPEDARALVILGNALAARGELVGAEGLYQRASDLDPKLAAAPYNLARLLELRVASLPEHQVPAQLDRIQVAVAKAKQIDPALELPPSKGELRMNRLLLSPGLPRWSMQTLADPGMDPERVHSQVTRLAVLGDLELPLEGLTPLAALLPLVLSGMLLGLGALRTSLGASKICNKCGRAVCRRCDGELARGSEMCQQCVNVFARKGLVPGPLQARKQQEVERHHSRMDKVALALGVLCGGAGHLFSGLPVRGALYAGAFFFIGATAYFGAGVVRAPYGDPLWLVRWAVLVPAFLGLYLLPLYRLFRRQAQ